MSNIPNWKAAPSMEDLLALSAALLAPWRYPGGSCWHWSPIGGSRRLSAALGGSRRLAWGILADLAGTGHLSAALGGSSGSLAVSWRISPALSPDSIWHYGAKLRLVT